MRESAVSDRIETRLHDIGLSLPDVAPTGQFLSVRLVGSLAYVSGHAPFDSGEFRCIGKVGRELDIAQARDAAVAAVLGCLASAKALLGSLDQVSSVVKMTGFVNCTDDFVALPAVTNAASELLIHLWGSGGHHARTTVGVASLPHGVAVEIELLLEAVAAT